MTTLEKIDRVKSMLGQVEIYREALQLYLKGLQSTLYKENQKEILRVKKPKKEDSLAREREKYLRKIENGKRGLNA